MTSLSVAIAIVTFLNALVSIAGAVYAFATIRGKVAALWMTGQILLAILAIASPFFLLLFQNSGADLATAVLSQNLVLVGLSLVVSILFVLVVARVSRLKKASFQ